MLNSIDFHKRLLAYGRRKGMGDEANDFASFGVIRFIESGGKGCPEWLLADYCRKKYGRVPAHLALQNYRFNNPISLDEPVRDDDFDGRAQRLYHEKIGAPPPEPEDTEVRELALSKLPPRARPLAELYLDGLQHTRLRLITPWRLWRHCTPKRIKLALAKAKAELALREAGELPPIDMRLEIDWIEL